MSIKPRLTLKPLWLSLAALMISAIPFSANAGEKTVGLRAGYNTRAESAIAGLFFQYRFSPHFGIAPNVDYYFRHNDTDALSINLNTHFPFSLGAQSRAALYPLAGLNYTSWNYHFDDTVNDDVTTRVSRLGLNIGGGFEFYATQSLKLSFEAKATFIKQYTSGSFTLSIGYVF